MTAAKRAVAELLYGHDEPMTVDEIVDALGEHDRSVIYRCVAQFEQLGIAEHVHLGHGQAVYRRCGLGTVPVHCSSCGTVHPLSVHDVESFARTVEERTGIRVDLTHFPLTGACRGCIS